MREWQGIRDDQTTVGGDAFTDARGVGYAIDGELQRRPGLTYLSAVGGTSLGSFRSPTTNAWATLTEADGDVQAVAIASGTATSLASGYAVDESPVWYNAGPRTYVTNDFDRVKVWDGVWSTLRDAGIAGPAAAMAGPTSTAAGSCTAGVHLLRYCFIDSTSPGGAYRSNPSLPLTYTVVAGQQQLTFSVGAAATDIISSTDPKVDTIAVQMTTADGEVYYVAATCANTATSVVVDLADSALVQQELAALYDEEGHEQPPPAAWGFESNNYTFLGGYHLRTRTVGVTNGLATVSGTNFSPLWAGRLARFGSDPTSYVILSATSTVITLAVAYTGTTDPASAAIITAKSPNRIYWSKPAFPESFSAAVRARDVLVGSGDRVVGGCDFLGEPYFMGTRNIVRLVFTDDPSTGDLVRIPGNHGVWNHKCIVGAEGSLYGWGPNGVWKLYGGTPRWISRAIDTTWRTLVDLSKLDQAHGIYDPDTKCLRWYFVATGDTMPQYAITFDIDGERWTVDQYRQGIDASAVASDDNGRMRLVVSDSTNARLWLHYGATDGVPSSSSGAYTVALGSTTTVLQVLDSLPTGGPGSDLSGVMLYRPSTGETRVIVSNTTDTITVAALATAPTVTESLHVGSIPWYVVTQWWVGGDLVEKKRAGLQLLMNPSATGVARVLVYRDFTTSPFVWTSNSSDYWPDGVTVVNGRTYLEVDLDAGGSDGFVTLPMPAEWSRALRAKVEVLSPAGTVAFLDCRFVPNGRRDAVKVTQE